MKTKTYLTPDHVRQMKPGETYDVAYNDFNHGDFKRKFKEFEVNPKSAFGPRLEAVGEHIDPDCSETWDHRFYEFKGPHRDGDCTPIMCSGSGAERVFFTKIPKAFK